MKNTELEQIAQQFIAAANRFDTQAVLDLFTPYDQIEKHLIAHRCKVFFVGWNGISQNL